MLNQDLAHRVLDIHSTFFSNFHVVDDQLEIVKEGAIITIRNSHAAVIKEHLRIEVDKWAKVEASTAKVGQVNLAKNASDIAYELVSVRL